MTAKTKATPTRNCEECRFFYVSEETYLPTCSRGHKPRHYQPKDHQSVILGNYGYKRKCADYQPKESK